MRDDVQYVGRDLEAMSFARAYHQWILDEFRPYIGRHLVEIGAGKGDFSRLLIDTMPESMLVVEPSGNMYPLLDRAMKVHDHVTACNGYISDVPKIKTHDPDTVFYVNVIEHISDDKAEMHAV